MAPSKKSSRQVVPDKPARPGTGKAGKRTSRGRPTPPPPDAPRLHRHRAPADMGAEQWQRALREQYGREQDFGLENLGDDAIFSDFRVSNPASRSRWLVTIRGAAPGDNHCTCPDFANSGLGLCKHIAFTLARLSARRGGKAALARGAAPLSSEMHLVPGRRQVRLRLGSACPPRLEALARERFDAGGLIDAARHAEIDAFIAAAKAAGHDLRVRDEVFEAMAALRDAARRQALVAAAFPRGPKDKALRQLLKAKLYPYQAEGALFAARAGRVLLGDEMGLGKTVQAIAAAEIMARHLGVQRVLVVCPTSLKHQWQREIERFAGREATVVQGSRVLRQRQYAQALMATVVESVGEAGTAGRAHAASGTNGAAPARRPRKPGTERPLHVLITSYDSLVRDVDLIEASPPELLIVDEAQRVKNWNTQAARALRRIASPHVMVLTGTPLENRLEELLAIVQLVDRDRLGPTWRLLHEHQVRDESGRVVGYRALDRIGATLAPLMLRRRKAEVLDQLPERIDNTLFVPLTEPQRVLHEDYAGIVRRIVNRWRQTGFLSDADQRRLTCSLQNMRMVCNSTWLLDRETDHGLKADELMQLLEEMLAEPTAKVVVFSQWVRTHEVLMPRLRERGIGHVLFHGGVPGERRGALVERFEQDPTCRLFLSTDAGGVGLNLQHAASTVVNMDLPWNPAVLEQRIGRVWRMGQRRHVQVVNLVAQGSIEHGMLGVLAFKKSLFSGVLDGGPGEVFMEGGRLAKFMQAVDEATAAVPPAATTDAPDPAPAAVPPASPVPMAAAAVAPAAGVVDSIGPSQTPAPLGEPPDPWADLVGAFAQLLQGAGPGAATVERDAANGQPVARIPLPGPQTLRRLGSLLTELADRLPAARPEP